MQFQYVITTNLCFPTLRIHTKEHLQNTAKDPCKVAYYKQIAGNEGRSQVVFSRNRKNIVQTWVISAELTHIKTKAPISPNPAWYLQPIIELSQVPYSSSMCIYKLRVTQLLLENQHSPLWHWQVLINWTRIYKICRQW